MVALERLVCAEDSWARACDTCASAEWMPAVERRSSGAGGVELGLGRDAVVGDAVDLLLPGERGVGLGGRRLGGGDLRLRGGEPRLRLDDRVLQPRGVEPRQRLPGGDSIVNCRRRPG